MKDDLGEIPLNCRLFAVEGILSAANRAKGGSVLNCNYLLFSGID